MVLRVHVEGAASYDIGAEIWQEPLADAINTEAEMIAGYAGADLLESPDQAHRDALRDRIVDEMTSALVSVDDRYRAPDGVLYSLIDGPEVDLPDCGGSLSGVRPRTSEPIVDEVLRFEDLPLGSSATRAAIVRWSDGTESQALAWYADEILICEGDHGNSRLMALGSRSSRRQRDRIPMRGT